MEKTPVFFKKKFRYSLQIKPNFKTKMIILEKFTMPKIGNGGPFGNFEDPICCKISKEVKEEHFGNIKKLREKSKNENFEIS